MTVLSRLVAKEEDTLGYITYVFECLDKEMILQSRYIMCTRYPNWAHKEIKLGEEGYLFFVEIRAGIDKWFDGKDFIPYNYNNIQFIKFIQKPREENHKFIM